MQDKYEWWEGQISADIKANKKQAANASATGNKESLKKYQDRHKYLDGLKKRIKYMEDEL
jgi:hypothetical protein